MTNSTQAKLTVRETMLQRIEAAIGSTDPEVQYAARQAVTTLRQNHDLDDIYDESIMSADLFGELQQAE